MKEERKFKVGDRVYEKETLNEGIIIDVADDCMPYLIKSDDYGKCWMAEKELELVQPKQFTKADLKDNHIVKLKNKDYVVLRQLTNDYKKDFNNNLEFINFSGWNIEEIYEFDKLVWKREETKEVELPSSEQINELVYWDNDDVLNRINQIIKIQKQTLDYLESKEGKEKE